MIVKSRNLLVFLVLAACTTPFSTDYKVMHLGKEYTVTGAQNNKAFGSEDAPGDITFAHYRITYKGESVYCYIKDFDQCVEVFARKLEAIDNRPAESDDGGGSGGSGGGGGGGGDTDLPT